jgi:hypothetical protein
MHVKNNGFTYKASRYWSPEEEDLLRQLVDGKTSYGEIAQRYFPNRGMEAVSLKSKKLGLSNNFIRTIYSKNENFWTIPNEENCYWAGFFSADGHVTDQDSCDWHTGIEDKHVLEKFRDVVSGDFPVSEKITEDIAKCAIRTSSHTWAADLIKNFGIYGQKPDRIPPNLSDKKFIYNFIRGYWDGDGTICIAKMKGLDSRGDVRIPNLGMGVTSSSIPVVKWIKEVLDKDFYGHYNRKTNVKVFGDNAYAKYAIHGQKAVQAFLYMSKLDTPCLDRKWKNPEILDFVSGKIAANPEAYKNFV